MAVGKARTQTRVSGPDGIVGIDGHAFVDLEPFVDTTSFPALHEEVCLAYAQLPVEYTGGCHRSMGIMPKGTEATALTDYREVIGRFTARQYEQFRALADDPASMPDSASESAAFGEEADNPLSRRQMLWLKVRFGVYFPWKGYLELIPNRYWSDKATAEGKDFTRVAKAYFPETIAFVKSLPFERIGRCNVMGLEGGDHGTVHRDGDPETQGEPDEFITFCPGASASQQKRLYLRTNGGEHIYAPSRCYWFNDHDYHGVESDTFFRYSIRVDGAFTPDFRRRLRDALSKAPSLPGPVRP